MLMLLLWLAMIVWLFSIGQFVVGSILICVVLYQTAHVIIKGY